MRLILLLFIGLLFVSCSSAPKNFSRPEDASRNTDPLLLLPEIDKQIEPRVLDENLSRFYVAQDGLHVAAIPITGALIDSVSFLRTEKADYNRFEYKKVSQAYRAFLFNKVSCFYTFIKSNTQNQANISNFDIYVKGHEGKEFKAHSKSEHEHVAFIQRLNTMFPKTYDKNKPRSIEVNSLYTQDLICSDKIDFTKPFSLRFEHAAHTIDLFWL